MPSISIILCVNKTNPWLKDSINSVLTQDDPEFEFLICANACSEALWDTLLDVKAMDQRVRLFRTSVGQLAFNLNFLANEARGDYLIRMDADDLSEPHRVRTLRRALEKDPVDILGSSVILVNSKTEVIGKMTFPREEKEIYKGMPFRTVFCHPSVALRRDFLLGIRGYLGGFSSEDTDLWLRARRAKAKVKNLPDALLRYRTHDDQSIGSRTGYAEVASQWLRELILIPSAYNAKGFIVALAKALGSKCLPGIRRYKTRVGK